MLKGQKIQTFSIVPSACSRWGIFKVLSVCPVCQRQTRQAIFTVPSCFSETRHVFSIGTVAAYSAKYSALVAYKILELFQTFPQVVESQNYFKHHPRHHNHINSIKKSYHTQVLICSSITKQHCSPDFRQNGA